jgi:hypothetical protein
MAIEGHFTSKWEQLSLDDIKKVLNLTIDSWDSFKISYKRENKITDKFCAHLRKNKNRSIHFFSIYSQSVLLDDEGEVLGKIDLKFQFNCEEKIYFSFECKRLRVNFPSGFQSLANKYVEEGMYRYNGQYAQGLDKGGMLGYVMDGEVNKSIEDVRKAIENHRSDLYMEQDRTLCNCSILSSNQIKETFHKYGPENKFVIYHIFLPLCN